jgi:heat shock protein HslJ
MAGRTSPGAALLLLAALVLAACGGTGQPGAESTPDPTGDWVLVEGRGPDGALALVDGAPVTLTIDGERWGGVAACNSYGGTVHLDGDRFAFDDGIAVTEMACLDEDVMRLESAYLAALQAAEQVELRDGQLVLSGPEVELVYDEVAAEPDAELVGTTWRLESLVDGLGPDGAVTSVVGEPTLEFTEDGEVRGDTGCNTFSGGYELDDTTLRIGPLATTRMACDGLEAGQEEHVLSVLESAAVDVTLEGGSLRLAGSNDRALDYRAD